MQFIIDFYTAVANLLVWLQSDSGGTIKDSTITILIILSIIFMSIVTYIVGAIVLCIVDALTVRRISKITLFDNLGQKIVWGQVLTVVLILMFYPKAPTFAQNRYYDIQYTSSQKRVIYENNSGVGFSYEFDVLEGSSNKLTVFSDWIMTGEDSGIDRHSIEWLQSKDRFGELKASKGDTRSVYYAGTKKSAVKVIETAETKKHPDDVKYKISKITVVKSGKITHSYMHETQTKDYKELEIEITAYIPDEVKKELKEKSEQTKAINKVMGDKEN